MFRNKMDRTSDIRVCRACLGQITDGSYTKMERGSILNDLYDSLPSYIPEFGVKVKNPCLCYKCFSTILSFHELKKQCFHTEETIRLYLHRRAQLDVVDLNDVLEENEGGNRTKNVAPATFFDEPKPSTSGIQQQYPTPLSLLPIIGVVDPTDHLFTISDSDNCNCNVCGQMSFTSRKELHDHLVKAHKKNMNSTCFECHVEFPSTSDLEEHSCVPVDKVAKMCFLCKEEFSDESQLREHMQSIHDTVCMLCLTVLKTKEALHTHKRYMHKNTFWEYLCHVCGKGFERPEHLTFHMRSTHDKRKSASAKFNKGKKECPYCQRVCFPTEYKKHVALHTVPDVKEYSCSICGWVYFSWTHLNIHILYYHFS